MPGILPENFGRPVTTASEVPRLVDGRVPNGSPQDVKVNLPANLLRAPSVRRGSCARVCKENRTWVIRLSKHERYTTSVHRLQAFPFIAELIHIHYDVMDSEMDPSRTR